MGMTIVGRIGQRPKSNKTDVVVLSAWPIPAAILSRRPAMMKSNPAECGTKCAGYT